MSIFSKLSQAKKAAKSHKEAQAQQKAPEVEDKPIPYKHVVTHAAIDALSGAPSSWREADRAAIKATNEKRRSMATRNSSSLRPMPPRMEHRRSYGANGGYYTNASGLTVGNPTFSPSPLASKGVSPTGSLNELNENDSSSSSSSQFVEMPYAASASHRHSANLLETLHANPNRKLGEAPIWASPPATLAKQPAPLVKAPVEVKKRSWGFSKRNSHAAAVAVH
ncbi:MAG: hypothetical protein Q9191_003055 [Dirinaria sp. TL-2023a]